MAKKSSNMIGAWAFLIGVILALFLGLADMVNDTWIIVLLAIGIIIGLLNIADEETMPFLLSGVVLIIASSMGGDAVNAVAWVGRIFRALLAIFVPATIVVAIKHVFSLAKH